MHFQNRRKGVAYLMCALMLSVTIMSAYTIPTQAKESVTHANLYKLVDMSLAKTGIVANNDIINKISEEAYEDINRVITNYKDYLEANGLENVVNSWESYKRSLNNDYPTIIDAITEFGGKVVNAVKNGVSVTYNNIADWLIGNDSDTGVTTGVAYKIGDKAVEYIRDKFDEYAEEEADFYYLKTYGPNDVNPLWFSTKTYYDNFCEFLAQSKYMYEYVVRTSYSDQKVTFGSDSTDKISNSFDLYRFEENFGLVSCYDISDNNSMFYYKMNCYAYDDWNVPTVSWLSTSWANYTFSTDDEYEVLLEGISAGFIYPATTKSSIDSKIGISLGAVYECPLGLFTNDGRYVKVFKNINAFKLYSVGQQSYYINQTNDYSTTNDNSVTFDGTYYRDNSNTYSYDIVQNEIDNSTEINEETVNNIVNNTTSTIVNNYYGNTSGDGNGNGDNKPDDGTTDYDDEYVRAEISGLGGALIGIALEHFDTLGNVAETIRDGMTEVTDPINDTLLIVDDTMNNLKTTTEDLGNDLNEVSGFMQALYSFIPDKVMNLLIAGSIASIGVGIWWSIRR